MKKTRKNTFKQMLKRFERATVRRSWMGAKEPSEWPAIKHEYRESKEDLVLWVQQLFAAYREKTSA